MRCTDCSRPVKPVVAIDIDGTLGDYHMHFIKFAEEYLHRSLPHGHDGSQEFSEALGLEKELYRTIKLAYRQGGMKRSMPVFERSSEFVRAVQYAGAEVWVTTTRPYLRLDNVDPDTRFWLDYNGIEFDGLLYDVDKYQRLTEIVDAERVVAVVEDVAELWDAAKALELGPLQRWTRWNRGNRRSPGSGSLKEMGQIVTGRVIDWKVAHDA